MTKEQREYQKAHREWVAAMERNIAKSIRNADFAEKEAKHMRELAAAERRYIKTQREYLAAGKADFRKWQKRNAKK